MSINIPPQVTTIGSNCFCDCKQLREIKFSKESKLQNIDKEAFCRSSILSKSQFLHM